MGRFRSGIPILLLWQATAFAQLGPPIPTPATVGVPYSFDFGQQIAAALQTIPPSAGVSISYSFSLTSGSLPPGLSLHSSGLVSGTPTTAGQYSFALTLNISASEMGYSQSVNIPMPSSITVKGGSGPTLSVQPGLLSFSFTTGAAASTQVFSMLNQGSQAASFSASASTRSGGNWLSTSAGGSAPAFGQGPIQVTADPTGLPEGTYAGYVVVTAGASQFNVSVVMTITGSQQIITLSQTGLTFRAVAGGGAPAPLSYGVQNGGAGTLSW